MPSNNNNSKYSRMGLRSWDAFVGKHGKRRASELMADKGHKGWAALVAKFNGNEAEAKKYVGNLGRATYFKHTRPGAAEEMVKPYFDTFPSLRNSFSHNPESE